MSKRQLAKILRESIFKPSEATGLMKVILDTNNVDYYFNRTIECIKTAQESSDLDFSYEQLTIAISLLALIKYENTKNL